MKAGRGSSWQNADGYDSAARQPVVPESPYPCIRCGYDLRACSIDGECPECGTPVGRTRRTIYIQGDTLIVHPSTVLPQRCFRTNEVIADAKAGSTRLMMEAIFIGRITLPILAGVLACLAIGEFKVELIVAGGITAAASVAHTAYLQHAATFDRLKLHLSSQGWREIFQRSAHRDRWSMWALAVLGAAIGMFGIVRGPGLPSIIQLVAVCLTPPAFAAAYFVMRLRPYRFVLRNDNYVELSGCGEPYIQQCVDDGAVHIRCGGAMRAAKHNEVNDSAKA